MCSRRIARCNSCRCCCGAQGVLSSVRGAEGNARGAWVVLVVLVVRGTVYPNGEYYDMRCRERCFLGEIAIEYWHKKNAVFVLCFPVQDAFPRGRLREGRNRVYQRPVEEPFSVRLTTMGIPGVAARLPSRFTGNLAAIAQRKNYRTITA